MSAIYFPAIIERGAEGFGVFFPDLPGCTSAGDTLQESAVDAEEALAGHLAVMDEHGDKVPSPSTLDSVERDPEVDEAARVLVRAERPGKSIRVGEDPARVFRGVNRQDELAGERIGQFLKVGPREPARAVVVLPAPIWRIKMEEGFGAIIAIDELCMGSCSIVTGVRRSPMSESIGSSLATLNRPSVRRSTPKCLRTTLPKASR